MNKLPFWTLTSPRPSVYESETGSVLEQTAKVYGAMNDLVDEYNEFVSNVNETIDTFTASSNADRTTFRSALRQEFQDFINVIDLKVQQATNYMQTNLTATANAYLGEVIEELQTDMETFATDRANFQTQFTNQTNAIAQQNTLLTNAINNMNTTLTQQNTDIDDAVAYLNTNLATNVNTAVTNLITNGDIVIGANYDAEDENLSFVARNIGEDTDLVLGYNSETETITITEQ